MSKIQDEIFKAAGLKTVRNEETQALLKRTMIAVSKLSEDDWEALSTKAQGWYNDAADAHEKKAKTLPDFPDAGGDAEQEEPPTRRGASKKVEKAVEPEVGVVVKVTPKRGDPMTGTIVEIDDDIIALKFGDGTEKEWGRDRIISIEVAEESGSGDDAEAEETDEGIKVGAEVTLVTKRDKEVTGKIVELDDEVIVLEVDGKDEEYNRDRVKTIKVVAGKSKVKEDVKTSTRRSAGKDAGEADTKKRSSNAGISVGGRIRELMCEDLAITEAEVGKILKKEELEFREPTLKMIYKDTAAVFELLKKNKKLK